MIVPTTGMLNSDDLARKTGYRPALSANSETAKMSM